MTKMQEAIERLEAEGYEDAMALEYVSLAKFGPAGYDEARVMSDGTVFTREAGSDEWVQEGHGNDD